MALGEWLAQNWFNLFSAAGMAGLVFAVTSLRAETKTRRLANLLTVTSNHREIWKEFLHNPKLERIRNASVDTTKRPITEVERVFVTSVILHIHSVYYAMNDQMIIKLDGLRQDVGEFISLPIPREVWEQIKIVQNDEFVAFVESCRNWK